MAKLHTWNMGHLLKLVVYLVEEGVKEVVGRTMKIARVAEHRTEVTFDVVYAETVVVKRHEVHVSAGSPQQ